MGVPSFSVTNCEIAFGFFSELPWAQTNSSHPACYSQPTCL